MNARNQEKKEDRRLAARKAEVSEGSLSFVSTWDSGEERLYLWNVMDPTSELFKSTVCGKT